ncbi:MAG TPA: arginine--tRNA ligase, partial [Roseiflexaceae bacterium]|nr:arginine--tRNA ligase [Roseiflexaceae bacterium]
MEYALDRFAREVRDAIIATGRVPAELVEVVAPKPNIPADLAFPAFRAAKAAGMAPPQLAQELAVAVTFGEEALVDGVAAAGPFLNFSLDPQRLTALVLAEIEQLGVRYGSDDLGAGQTIVVDYSSPNVAKTMHVGHIRSTIIGQALYNIFTFLGYRTIGDNHLGDWGTQFGMNIAAVLRWGKPDAEGEEAIAQIDRLYAEYNRLAKEDPALMDEARAWSLKLEQGDPTARELWQWMVDTTLRANQPNYERLGVAFDHQYGESFYADRTEQTIKDAIDKGLAYRDEKGAVVVAELEKNMPTFLLQRSDGGTLYHTRDIPAIQYRIEQWDPSQILYVVDARQELNFRQLFALARAMDIGQDVTLEHIKFGTIFDQNGQPLSTRKGNMIYLEDLLDDAHKRARAIVDENSPELSDEEKEQVAEIVGIGSVIYNDLFQDPRRNITLDWDRMLALE